MNDIVVKADKPKKKRRGTTPSGRGRGSPSKYDPNIHPAKAREWLRAGNTKASIAHAFGISTSTFCEWQNVHPEFSEALNQGVDLQEKYLVNSLFEAATSRIDDTGRYHGPNTTASIFLLKNIRPENWRDRREVEAKVEVETKSKEDKIDEILSILRDAG